MRRLLENLKLAVLKVKKWELIVEIVTKLCPKQQVSLGSSGHEEARHVEEEWMKRVDAFWTFKHIVPNFKYQHFSCGTDTISSTFSFYKHSMCIFI